MEKMVEEWSDMEFIITLYGRFSNIAIENGIYGIKKEKLIWYNLI